MPAVISDTTALNYLGRLGQFMIGLTGILLHARKSGMISRLKPILDELVQQHSFRLSEKIYRDALREAGELE